MIVQMSNRQKRESHTQKSKKPRCIARIIGGKHLWGTGKRPYLGTQCTRPSGMNSTFCTVHQHNRNSGIFGTPTDNICDISEADVQTIRAHAGLISHSKYLESKLPIHEYITSAVQSVTKYAQRKEWKRQIQDTIRTLLFNNNDNNKTDLDIFHELMNGLNEQIPCRDMSNSPISKLETEEFLQQKHWWIQQEKVTITDRYTNASTTFAKCKNKFYTQTKHCVGIEKYWTDDTVPDSFKNSDGIILDPITHCYLTEISLYPEAIKFHCLGRSSYSEYFYNTTTHHLQKSHEIQ